MSLVLEMPEAAATSSLPTAATNTTEATSTIAEPVASLSHIAKRYANGVVALDGLSLTLARGEIVALLGPNGAGKSTAVKLLLGLSAPTAGQVRIFGRDPRDTAARLRTGVMLQVGKSPDMLRVREQIQIFRGYYPAPMAYAEIVRAAGLEGIEERTFGQLSGGQRQRMLFALALAGDPDLLFLDEPTVGLDIEARRAMWATLRSLAARGKTILLTTHYLEEADALAHRIVVVDKGTVVCSGTPTEVKSLGVAAGSAQPSALGLKLIRCVTALGEERLRALPGVVNLALPDGRTDGRTDRLTEGLITLTTARPEAALRELLALDPTLHSLEVASPALEDAFLALTGK